MDKTEDHQSMGSELSSAFCGRCKHKTEDKDVEIVRTKNGRLRRKCCCHDCGVKKSKFISEKEGAGLTEEDKTESNHFAHLAGSAYEKPEDRAKYLEDNGLGQYSIHDDDKSYQNAHTAVYTKEGKKTVAFRGTVPTSLKDWKSDAAIASRTFHKSKQYKEWDATVKDLRSKYGDDAVEMLVGHSLGGRGALELGQVYDTPSHSFNVGSSPLELQQNVFNKLKCSLKPSLCYGLKKHKLWTVHGDAVSLGNWVSPYTNRYIRPKSLNPHALSQWYSTNKS